MSIAPDAVKLYAPPDAGPADASYPSEATLAASVLHTDLSVLGHAMWSVTPAGIVTVSEDGRARAVGPAGVARVVAAAHSGEASASATITVMRAGGLHLVVDSRGLPARTSRILARAIAAGFEREVEIAPSSLQADFRDVPAGAVAISAAALDGLGASVATASLQVLVQSGGIVAATVELAPGGPVAVSNLVPQAGGSGFQIELQGSGFGSDPVTEPFKILVGGLAVPSASVFRVSPNLAYFALPDWATRSTVVVDVGGRRASAAKDLYRLAGIGVVPPDVTMEVGGTASLSVTGTDLFGGQWPGLPVTWNAVMQAESHDHTHSGGQVGMPPPDITVSPTGLVQANGTGSYHVLASNGDLRSSASVTVNAP